MADFNPEVDYYAILQVHPEAHQEVIKRAYHTILGILKVHPDMGGMHEDAVQVNEAYEVLSDTSLRQRYDAARKAHLVRLAEPPPPTPAPSSTTIVRAPDPGRRGRSRLLLCPRCGTRNRLPGTVDPLRATCGKCRAPLYASPASSLLPQNMLKLPSHMEERLKHCGEVRLVRVNPPSNRQLICYRCGHSWSEARTGYLPAICPRCHDRRWSNFRLFLCRNCGYRFTTGDLLIWPYWLYPGCPSCRQAHWHAGCERNPFRWLMNRFH